MAKIGLGIGETEYSNNRPIGWDPQNAGTASGSVAPVGVGMYGTNYKPQLGIGGEGPTINPVSAGPGGSTLPQVQPIQAPATSQLPMPSTGMAGVGATVGAGIGTLMGAKAGATLGSIVPGAGTLIGAGIGALAGGIIDLGMTLYGAHRQDEKNEQDRAAAERWANIQNDIARKNEARQWKWLEEEKDAKYAMDFQAGLSNFMNTDIQLKNNLVSLWRGAK